MIRIIIADPDPVDFIYKGASPDELIATLMPLLDKGTDSEMEEQT